MLALFLFILCLKRTLCFASSPPPASRLPHEHNNDDNDNHLPSIRIASLNKYGGNVKYFDLKVKKNEDKRENSAEQFTTKNPRITATVLSRQFVSALRTTFLPAGFPEKTPKGYFKFCVWSWIQDTSTQLRAVLATQKILEGVGVGRDSATALSALYNYLVRDGCGMAANLLFTYAASSRFRTDVKRWRIFADLSVDIGITLEVAATLFPQSFFLPCICLGNMFKALCGVAAGACGGSINLYWAEGSDISDINAKFGAQHTVTGAIGLVFAGVFAKSVNNVNPHKLWLIYFALTFLHLYGNVRCMRLISFDYLNTIRMDMILREYVQSEHNTLAQIATPQDIAISEPLWFRIPVFGHFLRLRQSSPLIRFGVAYDEFCRRSGKPVEVLKSEIDSTALKIGKDTNIEQDGYVISIGSQELSASGQTNLSKSCVIVSFFSGISPEQQAKAYVHAWLLAKVLEDRLKTSAAGKDRFVMNLKRQLQIEEEAKMILKSMWGKFLKGCTRAGWNLSRSEFQTHGYEIKIL